MLFDQTMLSPGICFDFEAHLTYYIFKGSPLRKISTELYSQQRKKSWFQFFKRLKKLPHTVDKAIVFIQWNDYIVARSKSFCGQRLASDHIWKILPACVRSLTTTTATATGTAKKQLRFRVAQKTNLHHAFYFCTFICRCCTTTFCGGLERRQFPYKWRFRWRRRRSVA